MRMQRRLLGRTGKSQEPGRLNSSWSLRGREYRTGSTILRHEDVSTTQRSYIKTVPQVVTDAMKQLEARIARAAVVQQVSVN